MKEVARQGAAKEAPQGKDRRAVAGPGAAELAVGRKVERVERAGRAEGARWARPAARWVALQVARRPQLSLLGRDQM